MRRYDKIGILEYRILDRDWRGKRRGYEDFLGSWWEGIFFLRINEDIVV